jgi:hypothetical protein
MTDADNKNKIKFTKMRKNTPNKWVCNRFRACPPVRDPDLLVQELKNAIPVDQQLSKVTIHDKDDDFREIQHTPVQPSYIVGSRV